MFLLTRPLSCAKRTSLAVLFLSMMAGLQSNAQAGSFYYEIAGGPSRLQGLTSTFGASAPSSTDLGFALNNAVLINFGRGGPLEFQFGFQHRFDTANSNGQAYAIQAAYTLLRIQLSRLYLSGGYAPFVWTRNASQMGITGFSRATGTSSILAEAGLLWPIIKDFSLGAALGAQFLRASGGGGSSAPTLDASVQMRFYFGFYGEGSNGDGSNEFKGWRYPFGFFRD